MMSMSNYQKLKWELIFLYYRLVNFIKKEKTDYLTLVCPDCLVPLDISTDIDYINFGTCPECGNVKWVDYYCEVKPIARVVIQKR